MSPERRTFGSKQDLADDLAGRLAECLGAAIAARGTAALALSGGSTPVRLFQALARHGELDWARVHITLVDERWVDEASDRSNARLVRANLLHGPAAAAPFTPLYHGGAEPDVTAVAAVEAALEKVPHPFDAVVLGMGNDGHTASFFPGGDTLEAALHSPGPLLAIRAPGAGETRVTLTLPWLLATRLLVLHIEGDEKLETLQRAEADGPIEQMPVRAILRQTQTPLSIYWCP